MIPSSFREVARASIAHRDAGAKSAVAGQLSFAGAGTYLETSRGFSEVIAGNPKVKALLSAIGRDPLTVGPTGRSLVSVTVSKRTRTEDGLAQMIVSDLKLVGPMQQLQLGLTRRGDAIFGRFAGKEVRVKPMSQGAREMANFGAENARAVTTGRLNADGVFEAWQISYPQRARRDLD